ncbi:MAG: hypothetical protein ACTSWJ_08705 [Candidatus Heimdallarchaeaceae archaeon]
MKKEEIKFDSGMLQYVPRGSYYEEKDQQFKIVSQMWSSLLSFDRTLFSLIMILKGTGFSKGAMTHLLLSNPILPDEKALIPEGLSFDYETKVMHYSLAKEKTPRALKNLLMLSGKESMGKVNNARTRKLILKFIFDRDPKDLDYLCVNYKQKLKTLIRHALGIQTTTKILSGDKQLYDKWIGRYNSNALPAIIFIFGLKMPKGISYRSYQMINQYYSLREAAQAGDVEKFRLYMKRMPQRTVMGFRNTYKLEIDKSEIYDDTQMSKKEKLQSESAAKKSGAKKFKVDYSQQDIYDLWKAYYHKVMSQQDENVVDIMKAIEDKRSKGDKIDLGKTAIIVDASDSMFGSETRPLHPLLTALSIISKIDNIVGFEYVGGHSLPLSTDKFSTSAVMPAGATDVASALAKLLENWEEAKADNILVITDGYENSPKGMFQHAYDHFRRAGYNFNLIQINPVFSADAKSGTTRRLVADIEPLPVTDHKFIETEIIFRQMIQNPSAVKNLLLNKYNKLIGA